MVGARIGANSIVANHSLARAGQEFPPNSGIACSPARLIRECDCSEPNMMNAQMYQATARYEPKGHARSP